MKIPKEEKEKLQEKTNQGLTATIDTLEKLMLIIV
jgi:hypothetical protein